MMGLIVVFFGLAASPASATIKEGMRKSNKKFSRSFESRKTFAHDFSTKTRDASTFNKGIKMQRRMTLSHLKPRTTPRTKIWTKRGFRNQ